MKTRSRPLPPHPKYRNMIVCLRTCLRTGIIVVLLGAIGIMATGCAPGAWPSGGLGTLGGTDYGVSPARPEIDIDALEQRIHQLANHERAKKGLVSLVWNPVLNKIARQHSRDMARRHFFAHTSPEGHDPAYRFSQHGFVCQVNAGSEVYMGAENIYETSHYKAIDYVNDIPTKTYWKDQEIIAQTIVKGWMSSPVHRKNLLDPAWQTQGIGVAISGDDRFYATQDFC